MHYKNFLALGGQIGTALRTELKNIANTNKAAAETANAISSASQAAQGDFNQNSANIANAIMQQNLLAQQTFNSAQAKATNEYNAAMWERTSQFNAAEAEKNRQWQEYMQSTAFQRQIKDLKAAGLNPILAANLGGAGATSGATASTGTISGAMASSGLQSAQSANVGNYTGQMENTSNTLALFGTLFGALSTAVEASETLQIDGNGLSTIFKSLSGRTHSGKGKKF